MKSGTKKSQIYLTCKLSVQRHMYTFQKICAKSSTLTPKQAYLSDMMVGISTAFGTQLNRTSLCFAMLNSIRQLHPQQKSTNNNRTELTKSVQSRRRESLHQSHSSQSHSSQSHSSQSHSSQSQTTRTSAMKTKYDQL